MFVVVGWCSSLVLFVVCCCLLCGVVCCCWLVLLLVFGVIGWLIAVVRGCLKLLFVGDSCCRFFLFCKCLVMCDVVVYCLIVGVVGC